MDRHPRDRERGDCRICRHTVEAVMMTDRRVLAWLGLALLPWIARTLHAEFRAPGGTAEGVMRYALLSIACVLVAAILNAPPRTSSSSDVIVNAAATGLAMLGLGATSQVLVPDSLPRFTILATAALTSGWLVTFGAWSVISLRRTGAARRVVAVVNSTDAEQLRIDVDAGPWEQHFAVVDVISSEERYPDIARICEMGRATTLVLGTRASANQVVLEQAEAMHRQGLQIRNVDDFYDEFLGKLPLSALDRVAMMTDVESVHGAYAPLKRAIDLACALAGVIALAAILPLVVIGNLVSNRGPLWFMQDRVGRHGRPFRIWKLRTMAPGATDISGWTSNDDPRITPFGKVLRRTHLDELPQVLNILRGDLAVVGPRPEQVPYARQLEAALPFYGARHLVRPGLTGWAQVRYRYAASEEDAYIKLQYDLHYIRHESLATDLRIIWLTLRHIVRDGGR